jgi:hypothetical protein
MTTEASNLNLATLMCVGASNTKVKCKKPRDGAYSYAEWGASDERLRAVKKYRCACSQGCCQMVTKADLTPCCRSFWGLPKVAQDAVLWSLSSRHHGKQSKKRWAFAGTKVCRKAFCKMLGIGRARLTRTSRTDKGIDMRSKGSSSVCQHISIDFVPEILLRSRLGVT